MGMTVQFNNKESVLKAYDSRNVEAWSLFQNKQFLFKGLGISELENVLTAISEGGTNAIYTLKVYEGIDNPELIKSKTDDDGSFNFRLNSDNQEMSASQLTSYRLINERLSKLEQEPEIDNEEIEVNEKSIVGEILGNPAIAALIPILVEKFMKFLDSKPSVPNTLPQSNVIGAGNPAMAIEKMKMIDPNFENHVEKLHKLASKNKPFYDSLICNLDSIA